MRASPLFKAPDVQIARDPLRQNDQSDQVAQPHHRQRWFNGTPALLGLFFLSLFLLTSSGHLDSPDEELMFEVTRSLVERGTLDIGQTASPEQLAQRGADGRLYTHYAPLVSVLNVPFFAAGKAAAAVLPARFSEVVVRAAVATRDAVASAATCVLVYVVACQLGYDKKVAVPLTLAFGMATLVWPFAKYSWSEPVTGLWLLLAVESAIVAARSASVRWSILSSLACGLAIVTKITTAVAAPALLLYLVLRSPRPLSRRMSSVVPFATILILPLLSLGALNTLRFGSPFETGYFLQGYMWHPVGVAGLLLSPSKSLFLYAPLTLMGACGLGLLARRRTWEALLFAWLAMSHVLVYGLVVVWWHGDAAWGPRYLVPIIPYLILPAGALLQWSTGQRRVVAWVVFVGLSALGLIVNLGGVLVDQRASFVELLDLAGGDTARMDEQRWQPELSPVLLHWQEFAKRLNILAQARSQPVSIVSGTYPHERVEPVDTDALPRPELFPRWTSGTAVFDVRGPGGAVDLEIVYLDNRPTALGSADVQLLINGAPLAADHVSRTQADRPLPDKRLPWIIDAVLDPGLFPGGVARVEMRSNTWQPARDAPPIADIRELGVQIWDMRVVAQGRELSIADAPISPMPVSDDRPWSYEVHTWFYSGPQVADLWLWYVYLSDLPHWLMLLACPLVMTMGWSGAELWRTRRFR